VPDREHSATFQVQAVSDTTIQLSNSGAGAGSICKGDAGGPAMRDINGRAELVALHSTSSQGGCLGASSDRYEATETRVDGLLPWIQTHVLNSGFETTDRPTVANKPPYPAGLVTNVGGCCGHTGPQLEQGGTPHSGARSLIYSGSDTSTTKSYAYLKAYDSPGMLLTDTSLMRYWIYPQGGGAAAGKNSTCVAVDLDFSDGSHLRDTKVLASNNVGIHPARQCGRLTLNQWNRVIVPIGDVAKGKKVVRVTVGYDQSANKGGYRGYIDDLEFYHGCFAGPGEKCAF
jgi:hypothetical protein